MAETLDHPQNPTSPPLLTNPEALAHEIASRRWGQRMLVAIVGAPGSGKSTLSEALRSALVEHEALSTEVVPMDGFHYDNAILDAMDARARKGAPHTFDVDGLAALLARLRNAPLSDVAVPVFDREHDVSRASARIIDKSVQVLLVEGNYLLLDQAPWDRLRAHFDLTIKIDATIEVLEQRLMQRWLDLGLSNAEARAKVEGNDLPNARLVETQSAAAHLHYQ